MDKLTCINNSAIPGRQSCWCPSLTPAPTPAPTPSPNICSPPKACNVCEVCCKSYLTEQASCDACHETAAPNGCANSTPAPPTPVPTPAPPTPVPTPAPPTTCTRCAENSSCSDSTTWDSSCPVCSMCCKPWLTVQESCDGCISAPPPNGCGLTPKPTPPPIRNIFKR